MNLMLDQLPQETVLFASKLGASLIIFGVFWLASGLLARLIRRVGQRSDAGLEDVVNLIAQTTRIGSLVFGAVTALGTLGVNVSAFVAGLGLTGFALGFAFRDALSNLLAGVMILMHRPFRRGDRIGVAGYEGIVVSIDLRYTTLQADEKTFLIPNSILFTNAIVLSQAPVATGPAATAPIAAAPVAPVAAASVAPDRKPDNALQPAGIKAGRPSAGELTRQP